MASAFTTASFYGQPAAKRSTEGATEKVTEQTGIDQNAVVGSPAPDPTTNFGGTAVKPGVAPAPDWPHCDDTSSAKYPGKPAPARNSFGE
jgi:hypothetical protein